MEISQTELEILKLKASVFDCLEEQERIQNRFRELEEKKKELINKLHCIYTDQIKK